MSEATSIYEIPTGERERFAEGLSPDELQAAFVDVKILACEKNDTNLLTLAEDISTFCHILKATDLAEAKQFATEALDDLVPAVIERINIDDEIREHLRSRRS